MSKPKHSTKPQKQLEVLKRQAEEYLNGWKRAQADFENYKKAQEKVMVDFKKFTQEDLILKLLPILDSFNLALKYVPKDFSKNEWMQGILQIKNQLEELLKVNNVREIFVKKGDKFNPELHEAVKVIKGNGKNTAVKVLQKGYTFNGKLLRPAKVEVGE